MMRQSPRVAPSRLRRRIAILLRRFARFAVPLAVVAAALCGFLASRSPIGQALLAEAAGPAIAASARLGLVVSDIEVEGRQTTDAATILAALGAARGTPILAISPDRARQRLESLPWVRSASIERRLPGTLYVKLVEKRPLAVWQHAGKQELIDRHGEVIAVGNLGRFARLPTVVGDDAAREAAGLLAMLAREPKLAARVTAAIRLDDRRWNLRLDNAVDVLLPEEGTEAAWAQLATLEDSDKLLERDIRSVDMRLPDRLVLKVNGPPPGAPPPDKKAHPPGKRT